MKAVIKDKKEIARGTLWVRFEFSERISFKPGQIFFITLPLLLFEDLRGATRHFSIVSSPTDRKAIEMTTRLRGSGFKETLSKLDLWTEVEINDIEGNFVLPENPDKPLVFIAGGIGITPFVSMLRFIKDKKLFDYQTNLIYSNREREVAPFLDELQTMSNENLNFKLILTMTKDSKWNGEKRRINEKFLKDYLNDFNKYLYMIAGPPGFVSGMINVLREAGVDKENVKAERFSGY